MLSPMINEGKFKIQNANLKMTSQNSKIKEEFIKPLFEKQ